MNEQLTSVRGREAARILESDVFKEAFAILESTITEQWKACPVRDREGQVLLLQLAKMNDKFKSILTGIVESGKFAERQIDIDKLRDESKVKQMSRKVFG